MAKSNKRKKNNKKNITNQSRKVVADKAMPILAKVKTNTIKEKMKAMVNSVQESFKAFKTKFTSKNHNINIKENSLIKKFKRVKFEELKINQYIGKVKEKISQLEIKNKLRTLGANKVIVGAISFGLLMFIIGSFAIVDYLKETKVEGAELIGGEMMSGSLIAQNNPLIVNTTTIRNEALVKESDSFKNTAEMQANTVGKLAINPAVSPILAIGKDSGKPREGDYSEVSFALSMKNIQNDLNSVQAFDSQKEVYEMLIDGKIVATFDNPNDPKSVVDAILARNLDGSAEVLEVSYREDFQVNKVKKSVLSLSPSPAVEDVVDYLMTGTTEKQQYTVVAGDIPESIAEENGISIDNLEAANPEIVGKGHLLQIGQVLNLEVPVPMLTVITKEKAEYNDSIDFEKTEIPDDSMYEGETKVQVAGVQGKRQVVANITRENGIEVSREVVSEEVVSEPVGEVVVVGTKKAPPRQGTGTFRVPLSRGYVLSSPFGPRWGTFHNGMDMACSTGSPILASDGGVVTYAGWSGAYGYYVKIDHGGNLQTAYAHCSALLVSEGERVFQGQHIANVGSTGNSTGPHVHFEVIKNGVHVNPYSYIFN